MKNKRKEINLIFNKIVMSEILITGTRLVYLCSFRKYKNDSTNHIGNRKIKKEIISIWEEILLEIFYFGTDFYEKRKIFNISKIEKYGDKALDILKVKSIIDGTLKDIDLEDLEIKTTLAKYLGVSVSEIDSQIHASNRPWTKLSLKGIIRGLLFLSIFKSIVDQDHYLFNFFEIENDENSFFDGVTQIYNPISRKPNAYFTKLISVGAIGSDIVDKSVRHFIEEKNNVLNGLIIFVPIFPNEDIQQAVISWRMNYKINLHVLYLNHFHEMLKMSFDESSKARYIAEYILG